MRINELDRISRKHHGTRLINAAWSRNNIFNHPTFNSPTQGSNGSVPGAQITSPTFGLATATAYTERQIPLGARFLF